MELISLQEQIKLNPITEISNQYLVDQLETVDAANNLTEVPIIDLKTLLGEGKRSFQLQQLHSICKEWGIFQLVNHGVKLEKLKHEIDEFYKLPSEERLKYKIIPGDVEGYGKTIIRSQDQKIDWVDRFYMTTNPISKRKPHLFPMLPSSFRETLEDYFSDLQKLSKIMLGLIAGALEIDKRELEEMFEDGMQSIRMNYYPPCPQPDKVYGLTPHSDGSGLTFLFQVNGVDGFQVKKDGVWMNVKLLQDALVVNLGDIMEILSNGLYKSIEHRAKVNSEKERISIAMFFCPKFEVQIGPSPSLVIAQSPLFKRLTMEQYVKDFFSRGLNGKSFLEYMKI